MEMLFIEVSRLKDSLTPDIAYQMTNRYIILETKRVISDSYRQSVLQVEHTGLADILHLV